MRQILGYAQLNKSNAEIIDILRNNGAKSVLYSFIKERIIELKPKDDNSSQTIDKTNQNTLVIFTTEDKKNILSIE